MCRVRIKLRQYRYTVNLILKSYEILPIPSVINKNIYHVDLEILPIPSVINKNIYHVDLKVINGVYRFVFVIFIWSANALKISPVLRYYNLKKGI